MIIYKSDTATFNKLVTENIIADRMRGVYKSYYGKNVGSAEYRSWQNSTNFVNNIISLANLTDNYIMLEYELPHSQKRLDCMLFGTDQMGKSKVFLIELKQWSSVRKTPHEGNFVCTYTGGGMKTVPHPSEQVRGYHNYLNNFVEYLQDDNILYSCAYCHNFTKDETSFLFDSKFKDLIEDFPVYTKEDTQELGNILKDNIGAGDGLKIFNRFMQSRIFPSKKLLNNVSDVIEGKEVFSLLNEQIIAKNTIISILKKNKRKGSEGKNVIIIEGGPGTGKSVIALHVLAYLSKKAKSGFNIMWACKSKPFREGISSLINREARNLFNNLYKSINPNLHDENEYDAIIVDEAHRIEKSGDTRFTPRKIRSNMPMIDRIIRAAQTSIFFIDDEQLIRGQEVGSTDLIKDTAKQYEAKVDEVGLKTQFRCNGSNNYLDWLEFVLGYNDEKKLLSNDDPFDFRIFDSPKELYNELLKKESQKVNSARLTAGFCWKWSNQLDNNGELVKDVKIGDFAMPWETHMNISPIPEGYVRWDQWAYKPEGIKQVGCIYTAQGFEFDYIGVVFGDDFKYNRIYDQLIGEFSNNKDPMLNNNEKFETYIRNIYRVLMTRGLKGCFVYFVDKDTENYFRRYME